MLLPQTRTVHRNTRRSQVSRMENVRAAANDVVAGTVGGTALKRPSPYALPSKGRRSVPSLRAQFAASNSRLFGRGHERQWLEFTALTNPEALANRVVGALNSRSLYGGLPHPIISAIDNNGVVTHRLTCSGYPSRPEIASVLNALQ